MRLADEENCVGADSAAGTAPICHNCTRQTITRRGVYIAPQAYHDKAGQWHCVERRSIGAADGGPDAPQAAPAGNPAV